MRHILIVDEDHGTAERMAAVAAASGFTCATARSLREAHGQISLQKPDIDSSTCVADGSNTHCQPGAPLTGASRVAGRSSDPDSSVEALRLHAADYLKKPVSGHLRAC
jgi:DNA-binding response OmpR family regulator